MSFAAAFEKVNLCQQCTQPTRPISSAYSTLSITRRESIGRFRTHHQTVSARLEDTHVEGATWMEVTQHEAYTFSKTEALTCTNLNDTRGEAFWTPRAGCSCTISTKSYSEHGDGSFWTPQSDTVSPEPFSDSENGRALCGAPELYSPSPTSMEPSFPCHGPDWKDPCEFLAVPTPLGPLRTAQFLETAPPQPLSSEFLKDLSSTTVVEKFLDARPALSRPDRENISTLTLSSFLAVAQSHAGKYVVEFWKLVFQFWNEDQSILSGSAPEWIEIVSMDLATNLLQSFEQVAITECNSIPLDSVLSPLLDFAVELQDLSTTGFRAHQAIVKFIETLFARAENGSWSARCIGFVFDYYHGQSLRDPTFSVACLDTAYESLSRLIQTTLENVISQLEDGSKEPILCLASLLKFFRIETWIHFVRIIPYQMLSRLLYIPPFDGPDVRSKINYTCSQAAVITVLLACSELRLPGCSGCSGSLARPENQEQSLCICRIGMILDKDYNDARSFMKQGEFSRGLEILLQSRSACGSPCPESIHI